jgi:hypothetical protein
MQYMGRASHVYAFGIFAGPIPTPNFIQIEEAMVLVHVFGMFAGHIQSLKIW